MSVTAKAADSWCNFVWSVSTGLFLGLTHVISGWGLDTWKLWASAPVAITLGAIPMLIVSALLGQKVITRKHAYEIAAKSLNEASTPNEARIAFKEAARLLPEVSDYLRQNSRSSDSEVLAETKRIAKVIASDAAKMEL